MRACGRGGRVTLIGVLRSFAFADAPAAYEHLAGGGDVGKIVVER